MIEEHGIVLDIKSNGMAVVLAKRTDACDGCGSKALCKGMSESEMRMEARNDVGARKGDHVVVTVGAGQVIKAGVLIYLFPMLGFIAGAVLAQHFSPMLFPGFNADIASIICAVILMFVVYFSVTFYTKSRAATDKGAPHIIRIEDGPKNVDKDSLPK